MPSREQKLSLRIHFQPDRVALRVQLEVEDAHVQPHQRQEMPQAPLQVHRQRVPLHLEPVEVDAPVELVTGHQGRVHVGSEGVHPQVVVAFDPLLVDRR